MTSEIIRPVIGKNVYIAPTACVCGEVRLGDECTIMHYVVIRGDVSTVTIGQRVNVQDGTIIHTKKGVPLEISDEVAIGHRAVVHCRRVGANSLIGIAAIVLDDAEIGRDCIVAAGALVPPGMMVPDGKVVIGVPARVVRDVTDTDRRYLERVVQDYMQHGRDHAAGRYPKHND